ncbi:MAG: hypothetical protein QM681_21475 [Novosphingobium sp.]
MPMPSDAVAIVNPIESFRRALLVGVAFVGTAFDRALLMASRGVLFDFVDGIYRIKTTDSETLQDTGALSFSRASEALALTATGTYQAFPVDELRITDRGLLVEGAATNLCTQPVDLASSAWVKSAMTAATVTAGAPDGTNAAYDLTETTTARGSANGRTTFTPSSPGYHTVSLHLQRGARRYAIVQITGGTSRMYLMDFEAKSWSPVAGNNAAFTSSIEELSNGWFRVAMTETLTATLTTMYVHGAGGPLSTDRTYDTVAGTVYVRAAFVQFETGMKLTSPILTPGGTRAADMASIALPAGSDLDAINVVYPGGMATLLRNQTHTPDVLDLIGDGDHSWLSRYVRSLNLAPVFDGSLVEPTENGAQPYLVAMNGTYWWNGVAYESEAEFVQAMGATGSMGTLLLSGYIAPDAENLLAGVDFNAGLEGFATTNNATVSTEGGYLKMSASGAGFAAVSRIFYGDAGKAFRLTGTIKTAGVSSTGVRLGLTYYAPGFQTAFTSAPITGTQGDTEVAATGAVGSGTPFFVGITQTAGSGDSFLKNPVLKQINPAMNFPSGNVMVEMQGIAPAVIPSATQILWQADAGNAVDRVRVELRSDGSIHLTMQVLNGANGQAWDLALGVVAAGETFRIVAGCSPSILAGSLNGGPTQIAYSQRPVGMAYFRMGQDQAGLSIFSGTVTGYRIFQGVESASWMQRRSGTGRGYHVDPGVWLDGDSYSKYDTGIQTFVLDSGVDLVCTGQGGSSFAQQYARLIDPANIAAYGKRTLVWWDGSPNDRAAAAIFTSSISGDVLTVSAVASGALAVDQLLSRSNGTIAPGTFIIAQLTGTPGSTGTYRVSVMQTSASETTTAWPEFLQYKAVATALGHNRHLYVRSAQIGTFQGSGSVAPTTSRGQESVDLDSIAARIAATFGAVHVCNPQPFVGALYTGTPGTVARRSG